MISRAALFITQKSALSIPRVNCFNDNILNDFWLKMEAKYSLESRSVFYVTRRRCSDVSLKLRLIWVIIYLAVTHIQSREAILEI